MEEMQEELLQFKLQKVWTLMDLPKGKRAIRTNSLANDAQEILDEFYGGAHFLLRIASTTEGGWNLHQPRQDSPFDLEAYSDSDYAGASLDMKSTTGGCQFLGKRLISWQCKKQTIVANSTTEAEYVAAANWVVGRDYTPKPDIYWLRKEQQKEKDKGKVIMKEAEQFKETSQNLDKKELCWKKL
ncbi:hypothetical protein Tco_1507129 [Tanacetum coccineum]